MRGDNMGEMNGMTPPDMQNGENGGMMRPDMQNSDIGGMTPPDMQNGSTDVSQNSEQHSFGGGRMGGFGGSESTTVSSEHHIQINGGYIAINSQGDGIDSNGSIIIAGGQIYVNGPTNNGNSAVDHDGLFQVNGGTFLAIGSAGMIENPATSSAQNVISAYTSVSAGDEITIKDSSGKVILSYAAEKTAGHVMYSSADIKTGETYTIYVNGTEAASGTVESALTTMGTATGAAGGMGGFGGGRMQMQQ